MQNNPQDDDNLENRPVDSAKETDFMRRREDTSSYKKISEQKQPEIVSKKRNKKSVLCWIIFILIVLIALGIVGNYWWASGKELDTAGFAKKIFKGEAQTEVAKETQVDTSSWRNYKNEALGVEFRHPEEWGVVGSSGEASMDINFSKEAKRSYNVRVTALEDYVDYIENQAIKTEYVKNLKSDPALLQKQKTIVQKLATGEFSDQLRRDIQENFIIFSDQRDVKDFVRGASTPDGLLRGVEMIGQDGVDLSLRNFYWRAVLVSKDYKIVALDFSLLPNNYISEKSKEYNDNPGEFETNLYNSFKDSNAEEEMQERWIAFDEFLKTIKLIEKTSKEPKDGVSTDPATKKVLYTNTKYKFRIEFPNTWKNLTVLHKQSNPCDIPNSAGDDYYGFSLPLKVPSKCADGKALDKNSELVITANSNVSNLSIEEWQAKYDKEHSGSGQAGFEKAFAKKDKYIFSYSLNNGILNLKDMTDEIAKTDAKSAISTFKLY